MPVGVYFSPPSMDEATYNSIWEKVEANGPWPAVTQNYKQRYALTHSGFVL